MSDDIKTQDTSKAYLEPEETFEEQAEIEFDAEEAEQDMVIEDQEEKESKKINVKKEILSWVLVIAAAFALAYIITNHVIVKAVVPSSSMERTIMTEDRIVGNRLAYLFSEPKRGDIIIFKFPDNEKENYVKRIIGLPGETVEIRDGYIYIDGSGEPLKEEYLFEDMRSRNYIFNVPEESYFVLGDNRNVSLDARFWKNTYVKKEKIIGKVWFRYSPSIGLIK